MRTVWLVAVGALVTISACGDGGGGGSGSGGGTPGGAYSCRAAFPGADGGTGMLALCLEVTGGTAQDMVNNQQQCSAQGNTFSTDPCPRTGLLGGCRETVPGGGAVLTTFYYADGTQTAADIQTLCQELASVAPAGIMIQFVTS